MGISAGGERGAVKSDINVTPLVDVVLVLLIIFLVTTPIMMRQITVEVPRNLKDDESTKVASLQIQVLVRADGTVKLTAGTAEQEIQRVELAATLRPMLEAKKTEKVVFVDFQDRVNYGSAVSVMDTIKAAGAEKVALKTREKNPAAGP